MGRRRNPIDIVKVKQDINDGILKAYVGKGVLKYNKNKNTYESGTVIFLKDMQTGEVVKIGEVVNE